MKESNIGDKCPPGLLYYEHGLGIPFCYILTKDQTYPPSCPYDNYLEEDMLPSIYEIYQDQAIWVRAERNVQNGFGEFEWLDTTTRYLDIITNYTLPNGTIADKNCMVRHNWELIPVSCREKYPNLCIYSYSQRTINSYCSKRNDFVSCISTDLNLNNKCFCRARTTLLQVPRQNFCQKFAEPMNLFQNYLLMTQLSNKSPCWFGVENSNGLIHLSTSNQSINFTSWKTNVDFTKHYAAIDYEKPMGWILEDDISLKCAICESEVVPQNVTIRLTHLPQTNKIEIRIENLFDVHSYFMFQYVLICFSDYNTSNMKTKIISGISDLFTIRSPIYTKTISVMSSYPSYYWCETLQRPDLRPVISNKLLVHKNDGKHEREYALNVLVPVSNQIDPYLSKLHIEVAEHIFKQLSKAKFVNVIRPIKISDFREKYNEMDLLLHISTTKSRFSSDKEYSKLLSYLEEVLKEPEPVISAINGFYRSELCLKSTTKSGNTLLHWPEAAIGFTVIPKELCLLEDMSPVTRTCEGNFIDGGKWSAVEGACCNVSYTNRTMELHDLLNNEKKSQALSHGLCDITEDNENVLTIEVHLIAEILEKIEKYDDVNISQVAHAISNLMTYKKETLREAQAKLNSTDIYLDVLDKILAKAKLRDNEDYLSIKSRRLLVQISDLKTSNVTGVAIKKSMKKEIFNDDFELFEAVPLYNISIEKLIKEEIEIAIFLTREHVKEIFNCTLNNNKETSSKLIVSFFYNDTLFNEMKKTKKQSNSIIMSMFIPGFTCEFKKPLPIIFKPQLNVGSQRCGHWSYGFTEENENIHGMWKIDSRPKVKQRMSNCALCQYKHVTHFALLVWADNNPEDVTPETKLALNIITLLGCSLSLFGLLAIFITAIVFRKWRRRTRNIIMINFSAALTAQMIFLFLAGRAKANSTWCSISGAFLHYAILSSFAWMLIIAILQYRKFIVVFKSQIPHLILKCVTIGWLMPLIPVLILLTFFPNSYDRNVNGICYAQENYFYYGIVLPVFLIILINLYVFLKIIINICNSKIEVFGSNESEIKLQILLSILLFFLLGMSWIFGLCASFLDRLLFSYAFCLTATLQGFVTFLFFIVLNEKSRLLWRNVKMICFCKPLRKRINKSL